mmetsp:Transcript_44315/g.115168  ORF Transcript_44315/g.115168 Transcript_44315/m.115168 type:complete len:220 (-) Transcript_44315:768-1427(-)
MRRCPAGLAEEGCEAAETQQAQQGGPSTSSSRVYAERRNGGRGWCTSLFSRSLSRHYTTSRRSKRTPPSPSKLHLHTGLCSEGRSSSRSTPSPRRCTGVDTPPLPSLCSHTPHSVLRCASTLHHSFPSFPPIRRQSVRAQFGRCSWPGRAPSPPLPDWGRWVTSSSVSTHTRPSGAALEERGGRPRPRRCPSEVRCSSPYLCGRLPWVRRCIPDCVQSH